MLLFKDWDLWSSTCYDDVLVVEDDDYCFEHNGWQCDFYFGHGYDAIEEDAKNDQSCIEVLKIVIRKEDEEIEELEEELLSLEKELACAENKKWHEFCFDALSEKINWLEVSIRNLKNHHADDSGTQPLSYYKPAEPLHELMEAIRRDYLAQLAQDTNGQELLAKDCERDPNLTATSCASGHSDGMELADTSNLQVSENEEGTRQLVTKETGQAPNPSFSEEMENDPKEAEIVQERNAIVEYDSAYASRVAAAIRGREERLSFMPGDSQLSKGGNDENSALDQKLCDFASDSNELIVLDEELDCVKPEELDCMKPLQMVSPQQLCRPSNESSSLKRDNGKRPRQVMNIKNASHIPAKPQTKIIPYRRSRLKGEEKSQARSRKSETSANLSKSNMSLPSKPNNQWKMKPDLDALSDGEPSDSPVKLRLKASTILTSREQQKHSTRIISINEGQSNNMSLVRKITEREVQPSQHETGEYAIVPYDSNFSELQKKRKLEAQTSVSQPDMLQSLKLVDLRAIAKQHKVRKWYHLNKGALVEQLKEKLSSC